MRNGEKLGKCSVNDQGLLQWFRDCGEGQRLFLAREHLTPDSTQSSSPLGFTFITKIAFLVVVPHILFAFRKIKTCHVIVLCLVNLHRDGCRAIAADDVGVHITS
jgi:hypothetical protein